MTNKNTIIVYKKDGTRLERNKLITFFYNFGNLTMIFEGILGGYNTEYVDSTAIKKVEVIYD